MRRDACPQGGQYTVWGARAAARPAGAVRAVAVSLAGGCLSACVGQVGRVLAPERLLGHGLPAGAGRAEPGHRRPPSARIPCKRRPLYTVVRDAGHGGMDTGAHCRQVEEAAVCEQTVDALFAWLEADPNFEPVRTRENGVDLSIADRVKTATERQASLLLSVHANLDPGNRQSHGFECFPTPPGRVYSQESLRAAQCLAEAMGQAGHRLRAATACASPTITASAKRSWTAP